MSWPQGDPCDLARAFDALQSGIGALEVSLAEGRIEHDIARPELREAIGPALTHAYEGTARLKHMPFDRDRRAATVRLLLEQTRAELVRVERTFPAALMDGSIGADGELDHAARLQVLVDGGPVLRRDQAIAARFWGIAFLFEDPAAGDRLARALLREAAASLAVDLTDLRAILARIGTSEHFPPLVPPLHNRAFERLMVDILNEEREAATMARLAQDYSQKTDLRYHTLHGMGRRHGARVQVSSLTSIALHDEKLARIRQIDKLVVLSPIELARWINDEVHGQRHFHEPLDGDLLKRVWRAIGTPATVTELTAVLGMTFQQALRSPCASPRGPAGSVPPPLSELVRLWIDRSALRSTRLLRAYEDRYGTEGSLRDGRLRKRHAPPPRTTAEAWSAFVRAHRPGSRVRARVVRHFPMGLWAMCDGDIEICVFDRSRSTAGKDGVTVLPDAGAEVEVVLLDASHERRWYTAVLPDTAPDTVLAGARPQASKAERKPAPLRAAPAAWSSAEALALVPRSRIVGRVVTRVTFGLFVDVLPDVAGLLHVSKLKGRALSEFAIGDPLEVELVSIDLARMRIELAL